MACSAYYHKIISRKKTAINIIYAWALRNYATALGSEGCILFYF